MHGYFKAEGRTSCPRPATRKDKQGSPNEGTFSKQTPLHFKSCFQTEKKGGQKGLTCAYGKESTQLPRQKPAACTFLSLRGQPQERILWGYASAQSHTCAHAPKQTHSHTDVFTLTFTHSHKYMQKVTYTFIPTLSHTHTQI